MTYVSIQIPTGSRVAVSASIIGVRTLEAVGHCTGHNETRGGVGAESRGEERGGRAALAADAIQVPERGGVALAAV